MVFNGWLMILKFVVTILADGLMAVDVSAGIAVDLCCLMSSAAGLLRSLAQLQIFFHWDLRGLHRKSMEIHMTCNQCGKLNDGPIIWGLFLQPMIPMYDNIGHGLWHSLGLPH